MKLKRIFVILIILVICFSLTGFGGAQNGAENHLKEHLKDPDSLKVYSCNKYSNSEYDGYWFKYDAKNSYGGYSGEDDAYVIYVKSTGEWYCSICDNEHI